MIEEYGVGDKVILRPYRDSLNIEVIGYITKLGRGIINKIPYVIIKGVKKNSCGDFLGFRIKIYKYNFDLINFVSEVGGEQDG